MMINIKSGMKVTENLTAVTPEVSTIKGPSLKLKDISRQVSRWFSGAKNREGGKKEMQYKMMESRENKNE